MILPQKEPKEFIISVLEGEQKPRLDTALVTKLNEYSRTQIQAIIKLGLVYVNEVPTFSCSAKLKNNDTIRILEVKLPEVKKPAEIKTNPLNIIYDDAHLAVIDKPPNLAVYPGAGKTQSTLLDALIKHFGEDNLYGSENRPGFIHRIDKDTTGLLIITKTKQAFDKLKKDLQNRLIARHYLAICSNHPKTFMELNNLISRDENNINKRKIVRSNKIENKKARQAISYIFHLAKLNSNFSIVLCKLLTGRTHQLRLQLEFAGFPIYGDKLYNRGQKPLVNDSNQQNTDILIQKRFRRQALHAFNLNFNHPITSEKINLSSLPPNDMLNLIASIKSDFDWEYYLVEIEKILALFK